MRGASTLGRTAMHPWRGTTDHAEAETDAGEKSNWKRRQVIHGELWLGNTAGHSVEASMMPADWFRSPTGTAWGASGSARTYSTFAPNVAGNRIPCWSSDHGNCRQEAEADAAPRTTLDDGSLQTGPHGGWRGMSFQWSSDGGATLQSAARATATPKERDPRESGTRDTSPNHASTTQKHPGTTPAAPQAIGRPPEEDPERAQVDGDTGSIGMTTRPKEEQAATKKEIGMLVVLRTARADGTAGRHTDGQRGTSPSRSEEDSSSESGTHGEAEQPRSPRHPKARQERGTPAPGDMKQCGRRCGRAVGHQRSRYGG